jgi:hypothetical protein
MESSKYCETCKRANCNKKVQDMQDIKPNCYVEIEMVCFEGVFVPKELCTIDRLGGVDDCNPCNENCNGYNCSDCIVTKVFNEYARLSNQFNLIS